MGYEQKEQSGYDRTKDKVAFKDVVASEKRFLNVEVYSYDGGSTKIRIKPVAKNTNPDADKNKQWINQKALSGLTKEEAQGLIRALTNAVTKF